MFCALGERDTERIREFVLLRCEHLFPPVVHARQVRVGTTHLAFKKLPQVGNAAQRGAAIIT
jgi:hypothetical protein